MATTALAKQLDEVRKGAKEMLSPRDLIEGAIEQWSKGDLFFRQAVTGMGNHMNTPDNSTFHLVHFRVPGTDYHFALPEARSTLMTRLGLTGGRNGGYDAEIRSVLIQALDAEGYEYLGTSAPALDYRSFGNIRVTTKQFTIDPNRLGKVLKHTKYIGFRMDTKNDNKWLLVPLLNFVPSEVPFEGVTYGL